MWTTTGWLTWRRCPSSWRRWTASRESNLVRWLQTQEIRFQFFSESSWSVTFRGKQKLLKFQSVTCFDTKIWVVNYFLWCGLIFYYCLDIPSNYRDGDDKNYLWGWLSAGQYSFDANGIPEATATPAERAATLFRALDRRNLGVLTRQEFMEGYMQR